jgi:uncharacterized membrane protein YkvA (DUF1232 family)
MENFLQQVKRFIGKVPFVTDAVALYFCMVDPQTPLPAKAAIAAALAYFLSPADAIPDLLAGVGLTDDAGIIAGAIATVGTVLTSKHRTSAREFLDS